VKTKSGKHKFSMKLFIISTSLVVALVAAEIVYSIFALGFLPLEPESSVLSMLAVVVPMLLAMISGILCFKWLYHRLNKQTERL
jgi:hypothetical protein